MKITFLFILIMLVAYGLQAQKVNDSTSHKTDINNVSNPIYIEKDNPCKVRYFDFGTSNVKEGFEKVTTKSIYSPLKGFGIIASGEIISGNNRSKDPLTGDYISSKKPFYFVVDLPEGVYQVTMTLGGAKEGSSTTVKAESRRLMLENIQTTKGTIVRKTIIVDVRTPRIGDSEQIRLKERELSYLNWDNKLTLEFNGEHPCVSAIELQKADQLPVTFLSGNSTVTDQEYELWASWGQMFPRFLKPEIAVANYAESGETLLAFKREKRLQKLLSKMKEGDYLFIEFAHNDQKPGGNYLDPFTTYGTAWGVNHGVLSKKKYLPVIKKAWNAMSKETGHSNGFLGYVQGTGKQPSDSQPVEYDRIPNFEDYGLGCFLLAGSEVYQLRK